MNQETGLAALERSHDELRGALIAAGRHIRKFRHNPENAQLLFLLRRVLRDARQVRKETQRARCASAA